jgi:sugar phosphate isomerase/epimerase
MSKGRFAVGAVLAAAACYIGAVALCVAQDAPKPQLQATGSPDAEKLGWRLAAQAYTFRGGTFFEAIDKTAAIGVKYIEAYPGQKVSKDIDEKMGPGIKKETIAAVKAKLKAKGVTLVNFGVTGIAGNEADARKLFDWAKEMGIATIVTESTPEFLDKLCGEYGISAALHNHPNSWPPEKVLAACEGKSKRIGADADTGHWMRRNIKPIDGIKMLKGRIVSLHLKDLNEFGSGHDVPWGTGKGDLKAVLAELNAQGFKGVFSIEYEHQFTLADLAACVKFFNDTAKEIAAGKVK